MINLFEQYEHHGKMVWVRKDLKGVHRVYCLCWSCEKFHPEDHDENCLLANLLYEFCVDNDLVTPVWECARFKAKEDAGQEDQQMCTSDVVSIQRTACGICLQPIADWTQTAVCSRCGRVVCSGCSAACADCGDMVCYECAVPESDEGSYKKLCGDCADRRE